jgi:hypothetical protein
MRIFDALIADIALDAGKQDIYIRLTSVAERTSFFSLLGH